MGIGFFFARAAGRRLRVVGRGPEARAAGRGPWGRLQAAGRRPQAAGAGRGPQATGREARGCGSEAGPKHPKP